jgi:hypothetical protein
VISWNYPLPAGMGAGSLALEAGWDGSGPTLMLAAKDVRPTDAPLTTSLTCGYANGAATLASTIGISLRNSLGIAVEPQLSLTIPGGTPTLAFLPLGGGTGTTLSLQCLPSTHVLAASGAAAQLIDAYGIPMVADLLIAATGTTFTTPLWPGGKTLEHVLGGANLIAIGSGPAPQKYSLKTPLPTVSAMLSSVLRAVGSASITLAESPDLALTFVVDSGKVGLGLFGSVALNTEGSPQYSLLFGAPATWLGPRAGVILYLFSLQGKFEPELFARGLGLGLAGSGDAPLVNKSGFRLDAIDGYLTFDLDLIRGSVKGLGAGVEIDRLGLPLSQFNAAKSSNPAITPA